MDNLFDDSSQLYSNQELRDAVYRLLKYAVSDANFDVDDNIIQNVVPVLQKDINKLTTEDEKHLIEMEKRYFGKLSFRADTGMHAEQFKIVNVENNEELASVGS